MLRLILLIILILAVLGSVPMWPYSAGWGYGPSGGLGLVLIILLILDFGGPPIKKADGTQIFQSRFKKSRKSHA